MSSRLRSVELPFDEMPVAHHLYSVERRVRLMCRVSQVFVTENMQNLSDLEEDMADASAWCEFFYEFMDQQADVLQRLREGIEEGGPSRVTLNKLRERQSYIDGPHDQSRFKTRSAYEDYCRFYHYEPKPERSAVQQERED